MNSTSERVSLGIRANDQVEVIAGKEKGKTGKVLQIDRKNGRITVEKLNVVKRHVKASQKFPQGGIVEKELSIHYSNVQLICGKCNRGVRYGYKTDGPKKVRVCKRCDGVIEAVRA